MLMSVPFRDRLRCMQDRMEERSDTRINLLRQSVKKRKLVTNDDDEEVDPEAVLKSRNTTVKVIIMIHAPIHFYCIKGE